MDVLSLFVFIIYVSLPVHSEDTCPKDCRCRLNRIPNLGNTLWVSCNRKNFDAIPDLTPLKSVEQPIRLDLKSNRIKTVTKANFPPGLNVAMLFLRMNDGIRMEDDAFINMAESLQFLNIERIHLQFERPFTFLRGLKKLKKIVMSYNEQNKRTLPRGFFNNLQLSSLKEILLQNCDIYRITDGAFEGLESIDTLDLTFNKLNDIPMAIRRLPNLRTLRLGINRILKLSKGSFGSLFNLESLTLRENLGLNIQDGAFDGLERSLKHLSLRKCGLKDIPISKIRQLENLKTLDVGDNSLIFMEKESLNGSFCLTELDLAKTWFPLDDGIFEAQGHCLRGLTLNSRHLTTIPIQIFQGLNKIGEVNLKKNKITVLPPNAFGGISATSLDVSENPLTEIKPGAFSDLRSFLSIGLQKTKIKNINFILEYEKNKFREIWMEDTVIPCSCNISDIFDLVEPWTLDGSCLMNDEEHHLKDKETKDALRDNCTETEVKYKTLRAGTSQQANPSTGLTLAVDSGCLIMSVAIQLF